MQAISPALTTAINRVDGQAFRWLVQITPMGGVARRLCSDAQSVGGMAYAAEVLSISPMYESIDGIGDITIEVADNAANRATVALAADIVISLWAAGSPGYDAAILFRGYISDPLTVHGGKITADAVSGGSLGNRMMGVPVSLVDHPGADPDAVGQIKPVIYGVVKASPCLAIDAGSITTLQAALNGVALIMTVSSTAAFPATGIVQVDIEQMAYTGKTATTLTGLTRAAGGTIASPHDKATTVAEVQTQYDYLVADHPVQSIDAVYVDGVRQTGTDFTLYPNSNGMALVRFHTLPTIIRQVNLVADSSSLQYTDTSTLVDGIEVSHSLSIVDPGHNHTASSAGSTTAAATSASLASGPGYWLANIIDGNYNSHAEVGSTSISGGTVAFSGVISHTVASQPGVPILMSITVKAYFIDMVAATPMPTGSLSIGGYTIFPYQINSMPNYTISINVPISSYSEVQNLLFSGDGLIYIYEIHVNSISWGSSSGVSTGVTGASIKGVVGRFNGITYTPGIAKSGTVALTGNSVADTKIGGVVTADVHGWIDDATGLITGVPNTLLQQPHHIAIHLLLNYGGAPAAEVAAADFSSRAGTDVLSILLNGHQAVRSVVRELARQTGSVIVHSRGRWLMHPRPSAGAAPVATLTDAQTVRLEDGASSLVESSTGLRGLKNAHIWRAGRLLTGKGWVASGTVNSAASQGTYRLRETMVDLPFVPTEAQALALVNWLAAREANPLRKIITLQLLLDQYRLEVGDVVAVNHIKGGVNIVGDIISIAPRPMAGKSNGSMTITIEEA